MSLIWLLLGAVIGSIYGAKNSGTILFLYEKCKKSLAKLFSKHVDSDTTK